MKSRSLLALLAGVVGTCLANPEEALASDWILPTANRALYSGNYADFYMYVPRMWEGQSYKPWQGGQYGFVRSPVKSLGSVLYYKFHEGLDIRPMRRNEKGDPLDNVWSTGAGTVVHVNAITRYSNYGKYVVVEHDCPDGKFYSLYAHLKTASVAVGEHVRPGSILGQMGYTGSGLNRERAHVHFELNLLLHSDFTAWHDDRYGPGNPHGQFNGRNLAGIDVAGYLLAQRVQPGLLISDFLAKAEPYYKITVPKQGSRLELIKNYRWLLKENPKESNAWEITFVSAGVPLAVRGVTHATTKPVLTWVKDSPHPHTYKTQRRLTGSGKTAKLNSRGLRFIDLATGRFKAPPIPPPAVPKPAE